MALNESIAVRALVVEWPTSQLTAFAAKGFPRVVRRAVRADAGSPAGARAVTVCEIYHQWHRACKEPTTRQPTAEPQAE
eukprot:2493692-Prymnesium_polylepis.1